MPAQTKIVEPSFNIQTQDADTTKLHVLVEAGPQGLSLVAADTDNRTITHCMAWHFSAGLHPDAAVTELATLFATEPLLQQTYRKATLLYSFGENVLVPNEIYASVNGSEMLAHMYGDANDGIVRSDFVERHNLYNVYRLPIAATRLTVKADSTTNSHSHTTLLQSFAVSGYAMMVVFFPNSVSVLLRSNESIVLDQHFNYAVPEDVAWHLLAACKQFGVLVQEVPLTLFGMIDQQSTMYTELHKYFLNISVAPFGPSDYAMPEPLQQQPPHFFSHLFDALLCE